MTRILGSRQEARDLLTLMHDELRHWPIIAADESLGAGQHDAALAAAEHRARGAPLQYAAQRAAFRHLTLFVDHRVLIPRPETELLVDIVLDFTRAHAGGTIADVGTGSGAIALALASEGTFEHVIATDVSLDALSVARSNAAACPPHAGSRLEFRHGSLLAPVAERGLRAIVSNPPYIAYEEARSLPSSVRDWEPGVALFAGQNGMETTAQLVHQAAESLAPGGLLALETDVRRAGRLAELCSATGAFDTVRILRDLTGRDRFVAATRGEE